MIKNLLLTILSSQAPLSTYKAGLLQAKAYRILKHRTNELLRPYDLSSLDWAVLGLLFDHEKGFKLSELAKLLGIEAPFASIMIDVLEKKKLVKRIVHPDDRRAKIIILTSQGKKIVPIIEKDLREHTKDLIHGASLSSLQGYLKVLNTIIRNAEEAGGE